ncbi:hypothetical protein psyc5s11_31740 [Clostridium gelidum]|uniref:Methyltransferase n=1 Tax=Clostridium gelidum TaxID=704125 RepID=A0ABM7T550_9CLOT|nr:TylF/MycF/NovP-related O-methyltransferase [Clostridium gelidum]BCZ47107.1 hypothetical protein psyc5s11_31740 [Clostridium gelidum]
MLKEILKKIYFKISKIFCTNYFLGYIDIDREVFLNTVDPVRYSSMMLAIRTIEKENIMGCFAEVGVYRGKTSKIIHALAPEKKYYLFDTFEGFPNEDLQGFQKNDNRFKDTSLGYVKKYIGDLNNINFKVGYFPETTKGVEDEVFSFVILDVDLYKPTLNGLNFFYNHMENGGYIFIHDYNSSESKYAVSRAVHEFLKDKTEKVFEIPDACGTAVIRKL